MKNFRKILVLALAVIMCVTVLSVTTFADTFNPTIKITARFDDAGDQIIASVVTSQPCGAIKATFTYTGDLALDESKFAFADKLAGDKYVVKDNTVTFVLLAENLAAGSTYWADFYFDVTSKTSPITFSLSNVDVCDVNETLVENSESIEGTTLTLSANDLQTLGAQYRKADPDKEITAALRFGTKLDRNAETNALPKIAGATAVRCGYIAGFEFKVGKGTELEATNIDGNGIITSVTDGAINKQAKYYFSSTSDYMIYTYAVTGIGADTQVDTDGDEVKDAYVKDLPIVVRPYVIYKNNGEYGIAYGAQVSKSYSDVEAVSELLKDNNN